MLKGTEDFAVAACKSDADFGRLAALLMNTPHGSEKACRALWDGLDEPTRETLLGWFAEWDGGEKWNPKPKGMKVKSS